MTLYVQEENYHFDGYVAGIIVDEEIDTRVEIKAKNFALYKKFFCLNVVAL